jgi:hypothetical protein
VWPSPVSRGLTGKVRRRNRAPTTMVGAPFALSASIRNRRRSSSLIGPVPKRTLPKLARGRDERWQPLWQTRRLILAFRHKHLGSAHGRLRAISAAKVCLGVAVVALRKFPIETFCRPAPDPPALAAPRP